MLRVHAPAGLADALMSPRRTAGNCAFIGQKFDTFKGQLSSTYGVAGVHEGSRGCAALWFGF